ncbi:hypothetical protein [Streptomyces sp. NPDC018833]
MTASSLTTASRDNPSTRTFYKSLGFAEFDGKIVYRVDTGTA